MNFLPKNKLTNRGIYMKKFLLSIITTSIMLLSCVNVLFSQGEYTVGLNVSYPLVTGAYFDGSGTTTGPSVGVNVGTPYSFDLASYSVGVGVGIEIANMGADVGFNYTGFYLSLSTTVYELQSGPISVNGGLGMCGGLAATGSIIYDYAVTDLPIVIQPYARTTVLLDANGDGTKSFLMGIGANINYSF